MITVSGVSEADVRMMAQIANMLNAGEWSVSGKDVCACADSIRWFHQLAVLASQAYSQAKETPEAPEASPPPAAADTKPSGSLPGDVKIKSYNPGKIGKK